MGKGKVRGQKKSREKEGWDRRGGVPGKEEG